MIQYHPILSFLDQFPNSQGTWNSRWSQRTWWASNVSPPWIYLSDPRPFPTAFGSPNCRRSDSPPGDSMILFACLMKSKIAWTWRIEHIIFHDAKWAIFASLKLSEMTSEAPPWWFEEPQGRLPRNSSPLSATHLRKRHHDITRGMSVRKCRGWMVVVGFGWLHPVPVITTTLVVPSPTSLSWALLMSTKILAAGWTSADATYGSLI